MYIVFDFETTGLDYKKEQVIEIAAARLDENLQPINTFQTMVALGKLEDGSQRTLPQFIRQLTGITEEDLKDGMPEEEAMERLKRYIADDIVVAQYASFDLSYLSKVLSPDKFICTRSMARLLRPDEYASLDNLIKIYDIKNLDPHRAYADVEATIQVFQKQKAECDEKGIEYMNVLIDSNERPLTFIPDNAIVEYMEFDKK